MRELFQRVCTCGHIKALHGSPGDRECRICRRNWKHMRGPLPCYRFQWRILERFRRLIPVTS